MNNVSSRVAVLQDKGLERVQRILVAIADNRHAPMELQLAQNLQRGVGADVTIFHVMTAETADSQA